MSYILFNWPLS